jgi:hypothetical protein
MREECSTIHTRPPPWILAAKMLFDFRLLVKLNSLLRAIVLLYSLARLKHVARQSDYSS